MSKLETYRNEIITHYKEGLSYASIGKTYNVSSSTVRSFLLSCGIKSRPSTVKKESLCDKYKNEILKMYNNDEMSVIEISKILNISKSTIYFSFSRWGIDAKSFTEMNKTKLNDNYFEIIDTPDKAYWLGFMYADGYITGEYVGISLHSKDKDHLEKFRDAINSTQNINDYHNKTTAYSRIMFKSPKMVKDLINKGCIYKKSLLLVFPNKNQVPTHLLNHFIRGYFDGDGSLSINPKKQNYSFKLCGTKEFLKSVVEILNCEISDNFNYTFCKRYKDDKNNYSIGYGGRLKAIKIMDWLYQNSVNSIYLQRKHDIYQTLKQL